MHDLDRATEQITIKLDWVNDIGRHREFGSTGNQVQPPRLEMAQYDPLWEIAGTAILQHVLHSQPTDVRGYCRTAETRKAGLVSRIEFGSPLDIYIAGLGFGLGVLVRRNQNEFLFEQQLHLQSGPALRCVHHANVYSPLEESLHQFGFKPNFGANRYFR